MIKGTISTTELLWVSNFAVRSFMLGCTLEAYRVASTRGTGMIKFLTIITLLGSVKFIGFNSYGEAKEFFNIKNGSLVIRGENIDEEDR